MSVLPYACNNWTLNERLGEKARWELHKDAVCIINQILKVALYKTAAVQPLVSQAI